MSCQLSTINYQIMIKHIFKIIWAQRKSNGWILGELVIVMCALWFMMDKLWVDVRCYNAVSYTHLHPIQTADPPSVIYQA